MVQLSDDQAALGLGRRRQRLECLEPLALKRALGRDDGVPVVGRLVELYRKVARDDDPPAVGLLAPP